MIVTTNAGDSREATRFYGDGSFDCPYCSHPVVTPSTTCDNPWCDAHPSMSAEIIHQRRAEREKQRQEEEERKRVNQWRIEYAQARSKEREEWRAAQIAEAEKRGACTRCLFSASDRVRFIRHRGPCPKSR